MARTGGDITRKKILATAEKLFSEKGYDGTSIQEIADASEVNKALIYYHFKNKKDIIDSLFGQTLDDMFKIQNTNETEPDVPFFNSVNIEKRLSDIISLLQKKRKILTIMLMEALKNDTNGSDSLFQCAEMVISKNVNEIMHKVKNGYQKEINREELLMHEFFTGFVPIVFFALFKDKWADFFNCNRNGTLSLFAKVFKESHFGD